MFIDTINLNLINVFRHVYESGSMTLAARQLHLTQSGVSQHIRSLEDALGASLFDRVQQKLIPTAAARTLFERVTQGFVHIENGLNQVVTKEEKISGNVSLGTPIEFGNSILMPLLARIGHKYPGLTFTVQLDFASVFNEQLLNGALDFAFVDEYSMDKKIKTERIYIEELLLCISSETMKKFGAAKHSKSYYETLNYVEYQKGAPILRMWFEHHLKNAAMDFKIKAHVMDVQAIARLIVHGAGAGVLPRHVMERIRQQNVKLHVFEGCGKPLVNTISLAQIGGRQQSRAAMVVMSELKEALSRLKK